MIQKIGKNSLLSETIREKAKGFANLRPEVDDRMTLENDQEEIEDVENNDNSHDHPDCSLLACPDADPIEKNANAGFHHCSRRYIGKFTTPLPLIPC